ncbi:hypothetical protein SAMN05216386_1794 [Nitrosospira briensis]|uniref:Uncharacterized protein n=1 Tax=Nitrosospira briensis TaxID=35799 RepID=A0A1I5BS49_9PROT|nr:hypothetical protein SAMN05216386_1794 [Nitrosospira briensis]
MSGNYKWEKLGKTMQGLKKPGIKRLVDIVGPYPGGILPCPLS